MLPCLVGVTLMGGSKQLARFVFRSSDRSIELPNRKLHLTAEVRITAAQRQYELLALWLRVQQDPPVSCARVKLRAHAFGGARMQGRPRASVGLRNLSGIISGLPKNIPP